MSLFPTLTPTVPDDVPDWLIWTLGGIDYTRPPLFVEAVIVQYPASWSWTATVGRCAEEDGKVRRFDIRSGGGTGGEDACRVACERWIRAAVAALGVAGV